MQLVVLGLNHRSAAVEVRERFSFDKDEVVAALNRLYEFDCISECVILSTCNRTEIYAALEGVEFPKDYMLAVLKDLKGADYIDAEHSSSTKNGTVLNIYSVCLLALIPLCWGKVKS